MAIESDRADILSGVRAGETIGGPIAMSIENRDWVNWQHTMRTTTEPPPDAGGARRAPVTKPRPGHADLAGIASTDVPMCATSSSAPAPAKPRRAWPPEPLPANCSAAPASAITSHVFSVGAGATFRRHVRQLRPGRGVEPRCSPPLRRRRRRASHDRGDRSRARGRRHERRRLRSDRDRRARWSRQLRSVGPEAGRPAGAGDDVDSRDQSRWHRPRPGGGSMRPGRGSTTRSCRSGRELSTGVSRPSNNAGGLEGGVTNGEDRSRLRAG